MITALADDWIDFNRDHDTGIEILRAHFEGHAYDPHWHDSYVIGTTEQGVQKFNCRRQPQISLVGHSFLMEPGEIHDGEAPCENGFTYRTLYLPEQWLQLQLASLFHDMPDHFELSISETLSSDQRLAASISAAFLAIEQQEQRIVREACLDRMLACLTENVTWRKQQPSEICIPEIAQKTREFLNAGIEKNITLQEIAQALDTDRFRITRAFKTAYGISPHAYLVQLRLVKARELLAEGTLPIEVASKLCFADQSHLGRWFMRAYRLTPADYRKRCTNLQE